MDDNNQKYFILYLSQPVLLNISTTTVSYVLKERSSPYA